MSNLPHNQPDMSADANDGAAVNLVRAKVEAVFKHEPNAQEELAEAATDQAPLSKHQQFIIGLNNSYRSLAEIQTAWHNYYLQLPDQEKHEVWQEFYREHERIGYGPA